MSEHSPGVRAERARCEAIVNALIETWRHLAAKTRADGTFTTRSIWPPFRRQTFVHHNWERQARQIEAALSGLEQLRTAIRDGWHLTDGH